MTPPIRLPLILLALQQYTSVSAVSGSVDEFQCACGYNAARHIRMVRETLAGGGDGALTASVDLAASYGPLVSRILFVVSSRPEPTARWLWLFDLYANRASQQLAETDRQRRGASWLAQAVSYVGYELDQYLALCKAWGVGGDRPPFRDQASFENYVLENVTAIVQQSTEGSVRVEDFAPRWLYLNDVAADDDALRTRGVMPTGVGVDWRSAADHLSSVYRVAVQKWVFGTRELVVYQKKFIAAVAVTLMGHVLTHIEHCRAHQLLAAAHRDDTAVAHSETTVAAAAAGAGDNEDYNSKDRVGEPVGEYELTWMSIGALLEKYKSFLGLGPEKYYRTLVEVVANPAHDDRGFRLARRAIEAHMTDLGAGLFGPAAIDWTAVADGTDVKKSRTLIDLIALVDNNIGAAEKYLKNVRELLSNVDFKIIKKFMRSTHIWLL